MAARNIGSLTIDLILRTIGLTQGADKAQRELDKRAKAIERTAKQVGTAIGTALAVGGTAIAAATISMVRDVAQLGTELDKFSKISNTTTQEFQKWSFGAQMVGISQEKLADQFKDFNEKVGEFWQTGGGGMKDFFEQVAPQIGVTAEAFRNLSGPQALQLYFDSLEKANLSQDQMSFYLESMASDMTALIPLLRNGGEGFRQYGDEAQRMGAIIDGDTMEAIRGMREQSARLDQVMLGFKVTLASELLPSLVEFTDLISERETQESLRVLAGLLADVASAAVGFASKIAEATSAYRDFLQQGGYLPANMLNSVDALDERIRKLTNMRYGSGVLNDIRRGVFGDAISQELQKAIAERNNFQWRNVISGASTVPTGGGKTGNPFTPPTKGGGKSKEQQEAEQLQKSYESLMASMRERIALFNAEGEAAKVAYDLENGALKALDAAKKQELITEAQRYDALVKRREADEAAYELAKQETERLQRAKEDGQQIVSDLEFELELMRMTNAERATAIQLRGLESEAVAEYGQQIAELNRKIEEAATTEAFWMDTQRSMSDALYDFATGAKSAKDALGDFLDSLYSSAVSAAADYFSEQMINIFKNSGNGGSGGGWGELFSAFGSLFGGGKANGGWAQPNRLYEVNERGLEMATVNGRDYLLTGNSGANITPAGQWGGGGLVLNQQNYFDRNNSRATPDQIAVRTGQRVQRELARTGP